jgi:hypothetical protein
MEKTKPKKETKIEVEKKSKTVQILAMNKLWTNASYDG